MLGVVRVVGVVKVVGVEGVVGVVGVVKVVGVVGVVGMVKVVGWWGGGSRGARLILQGAVSALVLMIHEHIIIQQSFY